MENKVLDIDHRLKTMSEMKYVIQVPKTNAGVRKLPTSYDVCECFRIIIGERIATKAGMYPKTLQYLMRHSDISVTMNTYTHLGLEDAVEEMGRMKELENARREQEKLAGRNEDPKVTKKMFRIG